MDEEHTDELREPQRRLVRRWLDDSRSDRLLSICRDEDCPQCGWPETYAECTIERGPERIGCHKCGWVEELPAVKA